MVSMRISIIKWLIVATLAAVVSGRVLSTSAWAGGTETAGWSAPLLPDPTERLSISLDGSVFARTTTGWISTTDLGATWRLVALPERRDGFRGVVAVDPTESN